MGMELVLQTKTSHRLAKYTWLLNKAVSGAPYIGLLIMYIPNFLLIVPKCLLLDSFQDIL